LLQKSGHPRLPGQRQIYILLHVYKKPAIATARTAAYDATMLGSLGRLIRRMRRALRLSITQAAARLGIDKGQLSRWERNVSAVPLCHLEALSGLFGIATDHLRTLAEQEQRPPRARRRRQRLPAYECKGSLEQAANMGIDAMQLVDAARSKLTPAQWAELDEAVPRDSSFELLILCAGIACGLKLIEQVPLSLGCRMLLVEGPDSKQRTRYNGNLRRHALAGYLGEDLIVIFPQVWVASVQYSQCYRLDFLVLYRSKSKEAWIDLEGHSQYHRYTVNYDQRRKDALGLPLAQVTFPQVIRPQFMSELLAQLREIARREGTQIRRRRRQARPPACQPIAV
jgi:transcriptional regulator with XRE-family HTH domain